VRTSTSTAESVSRGRIEVSIVGDIFHWDDNTLEKLEKCKMGGTQEMREKILHMVGYSLEIAYDLCLSDRNNVSQSMGFEARGLFQRA